jgi:hypothetical protein
MRIGPVDVTVGQSNRRPADDAHRLANVKQRLVNEAARARFPSGAAEGGSRYKQWMETINQTWNEYYPGRKEQFFVDLTDGAGRSSGSFDLFLGSFDGNRVEVDELGSGQLEIFLLLASLVLNDSGAGLIFIDEPELHIDPSWHRPILRTLQELQPTSQFIVATHSPDIYAAAMSYERHFLVPDDDPRSWLCPAVAAEI